MDKKLVCVAKIASPHGIRGAVKLKAYTEDPESLADYSPLYNKDGSREFKIRVLSVKGEMLTVKIDGIEDRNEVSKLTNMELYADRDLFGQPDDDEFFYEDLVGMEVFEEDGKKFGVVISVDDFGSGDVITISIEESGNHELFAFTKDNFPTVNVKEGKITISPPEIEFVSDNDNPDDKEE